MDEQINQTKPNFIFSISNSFGSQTWFSLNTEAEDPSLLAYDDLSIRK